MEALLEEEDLEEGVAYKFHAEAEDAVEAVEAEADSCKLALEAGADDIAAAVDNTTDRHRSLLDSP